MKWFKLKSNGITINDMIDKIVADSILNSPRFTKLSDFLQTHHIEYKVSRSNVDELCKHCNEVTFIPLIKSNYIISIELYGQDVKIYLLLDCQDVLIYVKDGIYWMKLFSDEWVDTVINSVKIKK